MIRSGALLIIPSAIAALFLACSATKDGTPFQSGPGGGGQTAQTSGSSSALTAAASSGTGATGFGGGLFASASSSGGSGGMQITCVSGPNDDKDMDGWTVAQGDCNDCDPNVNPGAIDVLHQNDGGTPTWGDEDCSGMAGDNSAPCDQGLALDDVDPNDAAKAIDLCQVALPTDRKWGVLQSSYVRADGTPFAAPGLQVGLMGGFGPNVKVQAGAAMLALSSGHARTVAEPGACGTLSCKENATGTPPVGFPQDNPACPPSKVIVDDVAFQVNLRAPTNATGYSFSFKFYSFEFPEYVCDNYDDQFIALVTPPPMGSIGGNISFDKNHNPVSVNLGFFDVCDANTPAAFASKCIQTQCPTLPNPYCPLGVNEMQGTGFDIWKATGPAGGTTWLSTQAPIKGADEFTVRFAIWDTGNQQYDSTSLVDDFQWIAEGGSVAVGTAPIPIPK